MSDLVKSVKDLYITGISDAEATLASENLLGFFRILEKIESSNEQERQIHSDNQSKDVV